MWKSRVSIWVVSAVVVLALGGCVELDGQRVSWYYDDAKDELLILLDYDGVHDAPGDNTPQGAEQIPDFVRDGDVMLWDWPFHVSMKEVRKQADDPAAPPAYRDLARAILACKREVIGRYREPDGKLGAAQLITIPEAKSFVRKINAAINHAVIGSANLNSDFSPDSPYARTLRRIREAARGGHAWIAIDGHSLRVVLPVQRSEWEVLKGQFLQMLADDVARTAASDAKEDQWAFRQMLTLAASTPLSYVDRGDEVEIVLGRAKTPSTARLALREDYEPSLEKALTEAVPTDLDELLSKAVLDGEAAAPAGVQAVLRFGPPEERVRALLAVVERGEPARRQAAAAKLVEWAGEWNRDHLPAAPTELDATAPDLTAWKAWYAAMKRYPLEEPAEKPSEKTPGKTEEAKPEQGSEPAAEKPEEPSPKAPAPATP